MTNSKPSMNPANEGNLPGTLKTVLEKFLQGVDDMLPARVISFDRATNRATVQPLIVMVKTDGDTVERAQIATVPVFQYSGGGFVINFPLQAGDIGWLKANDRDISIFLQSYQKAGLNTFRKHSFEDAVFFPDNMRGWTIEEDGLVLQSMNGSQCIAIKEDSIKIKSDALVTIDAPTVNMTGNLNVTGDLSVDGEIYTAQNGGINLSSHRHSGVDTGVGNTGVPID